MNPSNTPTRPEAWPALPLNAWRNTCETLHMWTQIVGKVRLAQCAPVNHWWQVPFYVNARGLTTSAIPFDRGIFEVQFDFLDHNLSIRTSDGSEKLIPLAPRSVADFYKEFMAALAELGIPVKIWTMPVEIPNPIAFEKDVHHASYDTEYVSRFFHILLQADTIFKEFRGQFIGKSSPVHFFWGSFDLAVTRFSGRRAPPREGADLITREAYSHEVISGGFWPGSGEVKDAAFYAYAAPEQKGFAESRVRPDAALYHPQMHEFLLLNEDVRKSASPRAAVLEFLQSTYEAGANLAKWDRRELEKAA
jgi:hypothetical protein